MLDYLSHLWPWLLVCFFVGVATGLLARRAPTRGRRFTRWLVWAGLAFFVGSCVAALGALRGGGATMLESGLAAFAVFLIGAATAAFLAWRSWRGHEGWAFGLLPAALIWFVAAHVAQPAYERDLQRRAVALANKANEDASGIVVEGRDLRPTAAIANNAALMDDLAALRGLRKLLRVEDETVAAHVEKQRAAPASAPPVATPGPKDPRALLASLPEGPLTLADCEGALGATTSVDPIEFREKSVSIHRAAALALDKAAALIRRCPDVAIEVIGRADNVGSEADNSELSLRRASAASRYLRREGVAGRRLIVVGYGASRSNATADEAVRAQDRSIGFAIKPTM